MEGLSFSDFHRLSELRVCAKFNGSFSSTKVDGAYFIDRDGQLFRYVLEPGMGSVEWIAVTAGPWWKGLMLSLEWIGMGVAGMIIDRYW